MSKIVFSSLQSSCDTSYHLSIQNQSFNHKFLTIEMIQNMTNKLELMIHTYCEILEHFYMYLNRSILMIIAEPNNTGPYDCIFELTGIWLCL